MSKEEYIRSLTALALNAIREVDMKEMIAPADLAFWKRAVQLVNYTTDELQLEPAYRNWVLERDRLNHEHELNRQKYMK